MAAPSSVARGEELLQELPAQAELLACLSESTALDAALRERGIAKLGQRLAVAAALRARAAATPAAAAAAPPAPAPAPLLDDDLNEEFRPGRASR